MKAIRTLLVMMFPGLAVGYVMRAIECRDGSFRITISIHCDKRQGVLISDNTISKALTYLLHTGKITRHLTQIGLSEYRLESKC
jgi:hypothetical protein